MPINYNYQYGNNTFGNQYGLSPAQQASLNQNPSGMQKGQFMNTAGRVGSAVSGMMSSMPGAARNNQFMQNDPSNNMQSANAMAGAVGQAGPIGGIIGGIWSIGNKFGEADLNKGLQFDEQGNLEDGDRLMAAYKRGSFFDPIGSATRSAQGGGSAFETIATGLGWGAAFAGKRAKRAEKKAQQEALTNLKNDMRTQRLGELSQQYQPIYGSSFACGGKMKMNGGLISSYGDGGKINNRPRVHYDLEGNIIQNATPEVYEQEVPSIRKTRFANQNELINYYRSLGNTIPTIFNPNDNTATTIDNSGKLRSANSDAQTFMNTPAYQQSFIQGRSDIPVIKANGGRINPSTGLNGITEYKNGGTHEGNPLGGVPLGSTGNSVEEGEVRWNDFIFTDRY